MNKTILTEYSQFVDYSVLCANKCGIFKDLLGQIDDKQEECLRDCAFHSKDSVEYMQIRRMEVFNIKKEEQQ